MANIVAPHHQTDALAAAHRQLDAERAAKKKALPTIDLSDVTFLNTTERLNVYRRRLAEAEAAGPVLSPLEKLALAQKIEAEKRYNQEP